MHLLCMHARDAQPIIRHCAVGGHACGDEAVAAARRFPWPFSRRGDACIDGVESCACIPSLEGRGSAPAHRSSPLLARHTSRKPPHRARDLSESRPRGRSSWDPSTAALPLARHTLGHPQQGSASDAEKRRCTHYAKSPGCVRSPSNNADNADFGKRIQQQLTPNCCTASCRCS